MENVHVYLNSVSLVVPIKIRIFINIYSLVVIIASKLHSVF